MLLPNLGRPTYRKLSPVPLSPLVWSGPRPYSPRQLLDAGIKQSLSLQRGWYNIFTETEHEKAEHDARMAYNGVHLFAIPLSDFWKPRRAELLSIFKFLFEANEKVYFHCLHGKDRTGYVRALYRMVVFDWTEEQARIELHAQGFHSFPYFFWLRSLRADAAWLKDELVALRTLHVERCRALVGEP